jgi:hypothetical protein
LLTQPAETFLSLDLDPLYVSSTVLVVTAVDESLLLDRDSWVQRSLALFEEIASGGNMIASWRRWEMQHLDGMLTDISNETSTGAPSSSEGSAPSEELGGLSLQDDTFQLELADIPLGSPGLMLLSQPGPFDVPPAPIGGAAEVWPGAEQILAIAGSIQDKDVEWMNRAVVGNGVW